MGPQAEPLAAVIVTHDLAVARLLAHRMLVMKDGVVVEQGLTDRVLDDPQDPYTQRLISAVPVPDPEEQRRRRESRVGRAAGLALVRHDADPHRGRDRLGPHLGGVTTLCLDDEDAIVVEPAGFAVSPRPSHELVPGIRQQVTCVERFRWHLNLDWVRPPGPQAIERCREVIHDLFIKIVRTTGSMCQELVNRYTGTK